MFFFCVLALTSIHPSIHSSFLVCWSARISIYITNNNSNNNNIPNVTSCILSTDRPNIRSWSQDVDSWINYTTKLTCQAEGVPLPDISWSRSGTTNQKAINHTHVVSDLLIIPRNANDFGTYTCTATNILGSHKQSISLVQLSKFPDNSLDFCESLNRYVKSNSSLQPSASTLLQ